MSLDLDPKEVLQHLHSLGYCNISPELLKEFMRDLKKLIKYDQKKGLVNRQRREEMSHCCHQEKLRADMEANMDYGEEEEQMELPRTYRKPSPNPRPHAPEYCDADSTDGSELSLERNPPDSRAQEATRKENIPPRPPSSFIRPNDVGGRYKPKSDPVALYHYYQGLWSQNPQPGEDPRSRLRWNIRHQMLGKQKPLPSNCGCPCCKYTLVEKRLPRKCPLNPQNVPPLNRDQNEPKDQTYNQFDPIACSSGDELNQGFNNGLESHVDKLLKEYETQSANKPVCEDKIQQISLMDPFCSKCGKRILCKLPSAENENDCLEKKNSVTIGGPTLPRAVSEEKLRSRPEWQS